MLVQCFLESEIPCTHLNKRADGVAIYPQLELWRYGFWLSVYVKLHNFALRVCWSGMKVYLSDSDYYAFTSASSATGQHNVMTLYLIASQNKPIRMNIVLPFVHSASRERNPLVHKVRKC